MEDLKIEDRQPIIPLSLENVESARPKEFIFDYINNIAYVKLVNGTLFNITESETSLKFVEQYLNDNSDIVLDVTIKSDDENGEDKTIQESIEYIYILIQEFRKKEFKYAGSTTDGGPANKANKVNHSLSIKESSTSTIVFNGESSKRTNISALGLFPKNGGHMDGPMIPKQKFLLGENASYGFTLPTTGVEGQLFILLKEEV